MSSLLKAHFKPTWDFHFLITPSCILAIKLLFTDGCQQHACRQGKQCCGLSHPPSPFCRLWCCGSLSLSKTLSLCLVCLPLLYPDSSKEQGSVFTSETWWESQNLTIWRLAPYLTSGPPDQEALRGEQRKREFDVSRPGAVLFNGALLASGGTVAPCEGCSQVMQDVWHFWPPGTSSWLHPALHQCANQKMPAHT